MVGRLLLVAVVLSVGASCNQVFGLKQTEVAPFGGGDGDGGGSNGPDLDLDGLPDDGDPCVAAALDLTQDEDQDELTNLDDPCPLDDTRMNPVDGDLDQIPNTCDPFPARAGDTKRCVMTFNNTDLNGKLWQETDALAKWETTAGNLHTVDAFGISNIVSTIRIDGSAQPSYDVDMTANGSASTFHAVRVWARAANPATPGDVGCEISGDANSVRLAVVLGDSRDFGAKTLVGKAFPVVVDLRIQMSAGPDALVPNMRCSFAWGIERHTVTAPLALPAGQVGFGAEDTQLSVTGLVVYDRADVQPYP